jgi:enoyl-CoA hydratase
VLSAAEALQGGLVARIHPDLEKAGEEIAARILQAPPQAMRVAKRCIDRGVELDPAGALQPEIEAIEAQLASGQWMGKQ